MELEVVQMKIVDILCSMRKTVIGNSTGSDGTSRLSLEEFTEERQEILDTLHAFQAAVFEKSKESVHVPLVYIEKFTGCNLKTNLSNSAQENLSLIKTEPEADPLEEILSNFGDDYDSQDYDHPATPMDTNSDVNMTPRDHGGSPRPSSLPEIDAFAPPRKLQKRSIHSKKSKTERGKEEKSPGKRGRPRKNPPVPEIKEERPEFLSFSNEQDANLNSIIKEENFLDATRKSRSAAQTAAKRITDVKKLSRASFQYRPRKVPTKARKSKETCTKKTESIPESSSSSLPHSQNPNKILLNPILKSGKILKVPHKARNKWTPKVAGAPSRGNKLFVCEICPYKTIVTVQFEHHLRQHESPEVVNHVCPHCTNPSRQFSHKQSFDYHMNSHTGQNKMTCDICTKFVDPISILEHLQGHPDAEKIFQCSGCSYYCGTREGYLKHIRYHGSAALVCDVCSKTFRSRKKMLIHMHDEHNLLEKIKCDVVNCNKEYFEMWMLQHHKRRHAEAFVCLECNLQFATSRNLLGHQVREHSKEKPHQCSECPETFLDKSCLTRHLMNAHGAAKFKCPYCPKEYSTQGFLASHINLHEGISFPCDNCDKVFGDRRQLKRHQVVHKTTKDVICEECGKAFGCAASLKSHTRVHIGDKKHKCSYCPKAFVDRNNLICHERIHTGEKPYVCETCGKDFNQRSALNQHRKIQHKELIAIKNKCEVTATEAELNIGLN